MEEIEFSRWLFEGRPRQGKNVLPDGLNWLCYLAGSSKSHRDNSISCIFLESPHHVDMENVVKCYKHFFCYFNALKTHGDRRRRCTAVPSSLSKSGDVRPPLHCYLPTQIFRPCAIPEYFLVTLRSGTLPRNDLLSRLYWGA